MLDADVSWLNTLPKNERLVEHPEPPGGSSDIRGRGLSFFYPSLTKGTHTNPMVRVLWKSDACMVVFKPAGLATQAPSPHPSLEAMVREHLADASQASRYVAFPHRLDRPVSGVILVALSKRAANLLSQQFESRKVQKRYLAWVQGDATRCQSQWQDAIRKVPDLARCEIADANTPDAKVAMTTVRVLGSRETTGEERGSTLLELCPVTGRMHQLRLQCSHHGYPILGDTLYGSREEFSHGTTDDQAINRVSTHPPIALHAWAIEFHDPANGKRVVVQASPPWSQAFHPAIDPF
ncbi:MAG TPA: RNA pseudouridine synthase [Planctomycetaceae bacterium]|nr:RNA pseudouridine synthase [Planctomycetaceae bacterium]